MHKRIIKFTDFDGNEREEPFYFNLTEEEVLTMELSIPGGLVKKMERAYASQDSAEIISIFKDLIKASYGVKSPDGYSFDKDPQVTKRFFQSQAYSDLYMELYADSKKASEFFNNVVPKARSQTMSNSPALPIASGV